MKDVTAETASTVNHRTQTAPKLADRNIALHHCYGRIGISAVAAAARYQGESKNPAYAPAPIKAYDHTGEAA